MAARRVDTQELGDAFRHTAGAAANSLLCRLGLRLVCQEPPQTLAEQVRGRSLIPEPADALANDRVLLRPLLPEDEPHLVAAGHDPDILYWANWSTAQSKARARRWIDRQTARRTAGEALDLAVVDARSGRFAGVVQMHRIDWANRRASIGLWLTREARGKGLMTQALPLFVTWVFLHVDLCRLELLTLADNGRMASVAQRCGFQCEGLLRSRLARGDATCDAILFAALRDEWTAAAPTPSERASS
jgi:RimJ/RimL family protein N-acetyltransferase